MKKDSEHGKILKDVVIIVCRLILVGMFVYASIDKIAHPDQFARIIYNYRLLPGELVNVFALVLPVTEFLAGIFLIVGFLYEGSRSYLVFLLVEFIFAIGVNAVRGVNIECGCFTVSTRAKTAALQLILRDLVYLIPGVILLLSSNRSMTIDRLLFNPKSSE